MSTRSSVNTDTSPTTLDRCVEMQMPSRDVVELPFTLQCAVGATSRQVVPDLPPDMVKGRPGLDDLPFQCEQIDNQPSSQLPKSGFEISGSICSNRFRSQPVIDVVVEPALPECVCCVRLSRPKIERLSRGA